MTENNILERKKKDLIEFLFDDYDVKNMLSGEFGDIPIENINLDIDHDAIDLDIELNVKITAKTKEKRFEDGKENGGF